MPRYQGELDGLCGVYAIVNALDACGISSTEAVFKLSCRALGQRRWPNVLWDGTTFADIQKMIKKCINGVQGGQHMHIEVSYPFLLAPPKNNVSYWRKFDAIFDDKNTICAIIGLTMPNPHWIVATRDGGGRRILFSDSTAGKPYERKNRASIYAGVRPARKTQWVIEKSELAVFSNK